MSSVEMKYMQYRCTRFNIQHNNIPIKFRTSFLVAILGYIGLCVCSMFQIESSLQMYAAAERGTRSARITAQLGSPKCLCWDLTQINRLKKLQNHAAPIITRTRLSTPITPILYGLHWLAVEQRCIFKMLTLVHKVIYKHDPDYLDVKRRETARFTGSATTI